MASSSIGLTSCPRINPESILESDKCDSLLGEGEKLGSSLFKEEPSPRDVVEPVDSKSKIELSPQPSGQAMAIQVPSKLLQAPGVRSMKAIDHFRSLDSSDVMLSSLEPEDADEVPYFIQLYRPMIVKCVDCVPLLPQLRDIIDNQGTCIYQFFTKVLLCFYLYILYICMYLRFKYMLPCMVSTLLRLNALLFMCLLFALFSLTEFNDNF